MLKHLISGAACCCLFISAQTTAQPRSGDVAGLDVGSVDDPSLVSLVRETLAVHPQVLAAAAGLDASQALELAASRPVFNPELDVNFESSDTSDRVLALSQTLDWAGQRGARTEVADWEREVAEQTLAAERRDIAVELLATLAEYWTARELDALGILRLDLMQRFSGVAQQRRQAGDLTQVDLNVANLAYSQAQIDRASAAAALAETEQLLRALAPPGAAGSWPRLPDELAAVRLTESDVVELVAAVPEVRIQQNELSAADAMVTLRDRERRANPRLSLLGGQEEGESLIGLSVSVPLNVRNRFLHEVSAARATRQQADREVDNVTIRARARLLAATQRYALTRDAWSQWLATGEPNLAQQTELLERMWRAGELDVTEYLVQLNQTLDTQASALELNRQLWLAWFEWLAAAGQVGAWLGLPVEAL